MIADQGCAERGCACYDSRVDKDGVQMYTKDEYEAHYDRGWNSALEMAAFKLKNDFKSAFGEDTLASIAVYLKEMKK
jgi:hypothetical protein